MDRERPVVVLGEALCDLFPDTRGDALSLDTRLQPLSGGAPANVTVQVARLGAPVSLITAVGDDPLGGLVLESLREEGVNVDAVKRDAARRTGITLVTLDDAGERTFFPWREGAADQHFGIADLDQELIRSASVLHHGTVSMRSPTSADATRRAVELARAADIPVSVDVNLRPKMFPSRDVLLDAAREAVATADVVKATLEEGQAVTGEEEPGAVRRALHDMGPRLVLLTFDAEGAEVSLRSTHGDVVCMSPALGVDVVDATGAGDAFMGTALFVIRRLAVGASGLRALSSSQLELLGRAACEAGARAVTAVGACTAMPSRLDALTDE